jgi:hypothetical protein
VEEVEVEQLNTGAAGGSGIVIVKELNKATGVWSLKSQFSAVKSGTWPFEGQTVDYLVVAGGGGGGNGGSGGNGTGGGGAGGYRSSFPGGTALFIGTASPTPVTVGAGGAYSSSGSVQ